MPENFKNVNTKASDDIQWVENISNLMDSKFSIPGTKFRFGLDPIMGLVPGLGDLASFTISGLLVLIMAKHGASGKVVILMMLNIIFDALIGSIPLIGNIFDFFYKANNKNLKLLKKHYLEGKHQGSGIGILIFIAITIVSFIILIIYGIYKLFEYLIGFLF